MHAMATSLNTTRHHTTHTHTRANRYDPNYADQMEEDGASGGSNEGGGDDDDDDDNLSDDDYSDDDDMSWKVRR